MDFSTFRLNLSVTVSIALDSCISQAHLFCYSRTLQSPFPVNPELTLAMLLQSL